MNLKDLISAIDPISVLKTIFIGAITAFIVSKINNKDKTNYKRIVTRKYSHLLDKYYLFTKYVFYNTGISFLFYIIIGMIIIIYKAILKQSMGENDIKFIFLYSVSISSIILCFIRKKSRNAFINLLRSTKKHKVYSMALLVIPNLLFIIFVSISVFFSYSILLIISFYIVFFLSLIIGASYFGVFRSYYKYDEIKIYFKNATPTKVVNRKNYKEEDGFICLYEYDENNNYQGTFKYNKSDIAIIEFVKRDIDSLYQTELISRGFTE
jgi:membrane-associated HD superfamily phosphohydrolase